MERESFEDETIGAFLNEHFVSIKVDREERPDVDKIYMTFVQSTTGGGGWPLNCFLTPDLKPFFGGTYFPPDSTSRPAQVFSSCSGRSPDFGENAKMERRRVRRPNSTRSFEAALRAARPERHLCSRGNVLARAAAHVQSRHTTRVHGGFGGAPKFPQPSIPRFLLRCANRFGDDEAVKMVLHTCDRMAAGGIHDQLGGGFARYAVDARMAGAAFREDAL